MIGRQKCLYNSSSFMVKFFVHAHAIGHIFVRTIVRYYPIAHFGVERYGLRLVEACFKNASMITRLFRPLFKRIKDHRGKALPTMIRVNEHPFNFNSLRVVGSECSAAYGLVSDIGHDDMSDIDQGIELRIEWMVFTIPNLKFVIKHADQLEKISVGRIRFLQRYQWTNKRLAFWPPRFYHFVLLRNTFPELS